MRRFFLLLRLSVLLVLVSACTAQDGASRPASSAPNEKNSPPATCIFCVPTGLRPGLPAKRAVGLFSNAGAQGQPGSTTSVHSLPRSAPKDASPADRAVLAGLKRLVVVSEIDRIPAVELVDYLQKHSSGRAFGLPRGAGSGSRMVLKLRDEVVVTFKFDIDERTIIEDEVVSLQRSVSQVGDHLIALMNPATPSVGQVVRGVGPQKAEIFAGPFGAQATPVQLQRTATDLIISQLSGLEHRIRLVDVLDTNVSTLSTARVNANALEDWVISSYRAEQAGPWYLALSAPVMVPTLTTLQLWKKRETFLTVAWREEGELKTATFVMSGAAAKKLLAGILRP